MYAVLMYMAFSIRKKLHSVLVHAVGDKKGIDVSEMEGVDFAAFKETQYDILAAELRKASGYEKNL